MSVEIQISGLEKLLAKFDEIGKSLVDEVQSAVESGAQLIVDTAVTIVPVRTGNLKSTIHMEPGPERLQAIAMSGGSQAPYAPYVEFGTYKMISQPYMRPSADSRLAEIVALIRKTLAGVLEV